MVKATCILLIATGSLNRAFASWQDFQLLGIPDTADLDAVKSAYRREAMKWHPDTNSDPGSSEMFMNVSNAYERIKQKLSREPSGKVEGDAFKVFNDFMKGGSFSFSFSSGGGGVTMSGTSRSASTVIKNGVKITTTEVKDLRSGNVETTIVEEGPGFKKTRVLHTVNGMTNSVEL